MASNWYRQLHYDGTPHCLRQINDLHDRSISGTSCSHRSDLLSLWLFGQRERQRRPKENSQPFALRHPVDMEPGSPTSGYSVFLAMAPIIRKKHRTPSDSLKIGTKLNVLISRYFQITKRYSHHISFCHGNNRAESNVEEWLPGAKRHSNMEPRRLQSHGRRRKGTLHGSSI